MSRDEARLEISSDAIESSGACTKGFACLNRDPEVLCAVEKSIGGILFVTCPRDRYCPYQRRFGFTGCMCTCPTRKEIYEKYKI